jgi:hypothetical protein
MKYLIFTFILSAFYLTSAQTTYYVSSSQGNDSNTGTSSSSPFKSLSKVNSLQLNPGDEVLFKCGDEWTGQNLIINYSGTSQNVITFSSYGNGKKPVISLVDDVPNWNVPNSWTNYGNNIWYITLPSFNQYDPIQRLWINGQEKLLADNINGDNGDGTQGICSTHPFYENNSGVLYVYGISNPATLYSSIKYSGGASGTQFIYHTLLLKDANNVTIQNLNIQGGMYSSIGLAGSSNIIIKNDNIGQFSNWAGLYGNTTLATSNNKTSNNVEIAQDSINSDWNYPYVFYTSRTPYGLLIGGTGASYWNIHDNFIKDWWFGIYIGGEFGVSQYHSVYNNEITAPDFSFAKPMQISSGGIWGTPPTYAKVYDNYFHDLPIGMQISASGNKIFFNTFSNLTLSTNSHASQGNSGWGIEILGDVQSADPDSNYIFNNTFYNLNNNAIVDFGDKHTFYYNNLFAQCMTSSSYHYQVQDNSISSNTWKNNLFYYPGLSSTDQIINITGSGGYNVNAFNLLSSLLSSKIIENNIQYSGLISGLLNTNDLTLPTGSPALNAGTNISSLVSAGFKDKYGNTVNLQSPNIGATQGGNAGTVQTPTPAPTVNLSANKTSVTKGQTVTLSWSSQNATQLDLEPGIGAVNSQGSVTVTPQSTTTYTLTATGTGGTTSSSVKITVTAAASGPMPTLSITARNTNITKGQSVKLYWVSTNAAALNLQPGIGSVNPNDSLIVIPQDTTTYTLTASNNGDTAYSRITINVINTQTSSSSLSAQLSVDKSMIQNGASATLSWTSQNASSMNIQPGIGSVSSNGSLKVTPDSTTTYTLTATSGKSSITSTVRVIVTASLTPIVSEVKIKVFLQGAYNNNGTMFTTLNDDGYLPDKQPYSVSPWNYKGSETVQSFPSNIVDWVLVELRTSKDPASTVAEQAALLRSDGIITDLNGNDYLSFANLNTGNYYIVVEHRNHLSVMSSAPVTLPSQNSIFYDFTNSPNKAYGTNSMADLGNGVYGMYGGDADANGSINDDDINYIGTFLFQNGYNNADTDMNGSVNVLDYKLPKQNSQVNTQISLSN